MHDEDVYAEYPKFCEKAVPRLVAFLMFGVCRRVMRRTAFRR
jgi:hypothetical protein